MAVAAFSRSQECKTMILEQHVLTPFNILIIWSWDKIKFMTFNPDAEFSGEQGIVFGVSAQIRWRWIENYYHLALFADGASCSGWQSPREIALLHDQTEEEYYLWGQKTSNEAGVVWYDARIPHIIQGDLGYPIGRPDPRYSRIMLKSKTYQFTNYPVADQSAIPPRELIQRFYALEEK